MARQPETPSQTKTGDESALIRELAALLDETNLTEIEIERTGLRVRIARNVSIAAAVPATYHAAPAPAATAAAAAPADAESG